MRIVLVSIAVALAALAAGCATPQPDIVRRDSGRIVTLDIDAPEYNEMTARLYASLSAGGRIKSGKVVVLGPVATALDGPYKFDAVKFQEKLQTAASRAGLFQFSFAADAMAGNSAAAERYKLMQLQWEKEQKVDPELMRTIGGLAKIDFILFGRMSSQTQRKAGVAEVTYTFNWKLGDCETGLINWTDDQEIVKATNPQK